MSAFIELVDVRKTYGDGPGAVSAVDGISMEAQAGEWIAIMGPSGSGKTTLLNLIGCLDQASSGAVLIGEPIHRNSDAPTWRGSAAKRSASCFSSSIWCRI